MKTIGAVTALVLVIVLGACGGGSGAVRTTPSPAPASPAASPWASPSSIPRPSPSAAPRPSPRPIPSAGYVLPAALRGVEWTSLPTSRRIVALTFDGGSGSQGLAAILPELVKERVPATFFLTGEWVEANPGGARSIAADSSTSIGNHTWDHPYCTSLSDAQLRSELTRAETEIRTVSGRDPRPLFRFPYGDRDARTLADVNAAGYGSIRWTVDTLGWEGTTAGQSAATVLQRVKDGERPGEIVLMHLGAAPDGSTLDADALPAIIQQLRGDGYGFVAIWDFIYGLS